MSRPSRTLFALVLAHLAVSPLSAQRARANDRGAARGDADDTPVVQVWLEGRRTYAYGEPVRVWFNVNEDAFVIVARVDANGHLTVLHPSGRLRSTEVAGGNDHLVRGRRDAASFYATDRAGGGLVFALASYEPFDLSRLGLRDFDRYVTGTYVGRPGRVYVGDPHRIVERFASLVTFSDDTPFDYAVDYYDVDGPTYIGSTGYARYCGYESAGWNGGAAARWDDAVYYGATGGCGAGLGCGALGYASVGAGAGWGAPVGCLAWQPPSGATPPPPSGPPAGGSDTLRVRGWLPDSVRGGGRPDTVGAPPARHVDAADGADGLRRRATGMPSRGRDEYDDANGRSFAIPDRALRRTPMVIGDARPGDGNLRPDRGRPLDAATGDGLAWVRPPRDAIQGRPEIGDERLPARPGRAGGVDWRTGAPDRWEPPTRDLTRRFDVPGRSDGGRFDGGRFDGGRFDPPPTIRGADGGPGGIRVMDAPAAPRADPPRADGGATTRGTDAPPPAERKPGASR